MTKPLAFAQKSAEWLEKFHAGTGDKAEAAAMLDTYLERGRPT